MKIYINAKRNDNLDLTKILLNVSYLLLSIGIEKSSTFTRITL